MRYRTSDMLPFVVIAIVLGLGGLPAAAQPKGEVSIQGTEAGYVVTEDADTVLIYHRRPARPAREHARSHYAHPVYGLDGERLTENLPADHPHQHGLFWAWHQILVDGERVGDGWTQKGVSWDVLRVGRQMHDDGSVSLVAVVDWRTSRSPHDGTPFMREKSTLRIYPAQEDYRLLDVRINLRALTNDVQLGGSENKKGYGGLSARLRLPEDVRFTGPNGSVEPRRLAVAPRPWIDVSATFEEGAGPSGVAIFQHPSVPGYPQPWVLRRSGSMQNAKWPGRNPVLIPPDHPGMTLRYRLVIHRGDASSVSLDRLYNQYSDKNFPERPNRTR